jgi:serine/threonine protein kinase
MNPETNGINLETNKRMNLETNGINLETNKRKIEIILIKKPNYIVDVLKQNGFEIVNILQKSIYGDIIECIQISDKNKVIIKIFNKKKIKQNATDINFQENGLVEIKMTISLSQKKIPYFPLFICKFEDDEYFYMVIKFYNKRSLFHYIQTNKNIFIQPEIIKKIAKDILSAIHYLHTNGLSHRDISPENIFISDDPDIHAVLGDLAQVTKQDIASNKNCGKNCYISPEQWRKKYNIQKSDMFAFGIILFILLTRCPPWKRAIDNDLLAFKKDNAYCYFLTKGGGDGNMNGINNLLISYFINMIKYIGVSIKKQRILELKGLFKKYEDMMDLEQELLQEEIFKYISPDAQNLLTMLLCSEDKRLNSHEALEHPFFIIRL